MFLSSISLNSNRGLQRRDNRPLHIQVRSLLSSLFFSRLFPCCCSRRLRLLNRGRAAQRQEHIGYRYAHSARRQKALRPQIEPALRC